MIRTLKALAICLALTASVYAQATMTQTTLANSIGRDTRIINVASATGITGTASTSGTRSVLFVDQEAMLVESVSGTQITVTRGAKGTVAVAHTNTATVYVGPDRPDYFRSGPPSGACTATNLVVLPVIDVKTGKAWTCSTTGKWAVIKTHYVPPTQCTFAPTTLTTTNTYPQIGASNIFVLNGTSNAAAGTNTLVCNIWTPSIVGTGQGAILQDITLFVGSQTTAPTSLGTSTLGSISFPTAASSETASTVTPVAVGGTVTTTSPSQITTVTTAGSFLTIKHTYATQVRLSTDNQLLQYTMPFVQSAAAAMTVNTPGLLVHYIDDGF